MPILPEELQELCKPEVALRATVTKDYAVVFDRIRPYVTNICTGLMNMDDLVYLANYRNREDLIRYLSERLAAAFIEHQCRCAHQIGKFTVDLQEEAEIILEALHLWAMNLAAGTEDNIFDIANRVFDRRMPDRGPVPRWMPDLDPIVDANREIRHLAGNVLQPNAIARRRKPENFSSERVTDPALAEELWQARQGVYRAVEIASAIKKRDLDGDGRDFQKVWKKVMDVGAFLELYDIAKIRERIERQHEWIIIRTKGDAMFRETRPIGPIHASQMLETWRTERGALGSDIHIQTPGEDPGAPLPFSMRAPPGGKFVYRLGQGIAELIRQNHAIAGCVSDLRVSDKYAHMGFAGEVRYDAFSHIKYEVNRKRQKQNQIRFLIAEIFAVNGLYLPNWKEIGPKGHLALETPLTNVASTIAHVKGRTAALPGWERIGEKIPVWLPGDEKEKPHYLDVSWEAMIHDLLLVDEHANSAR